MKHKDARHVLNLPTDLLSFAAPHRLVVYVEKAGNLLAAKLAHGQVLDTVKNCLV
jgi:hypothetical protein